MAINKTNLSVDSLDFDGIKSNFIEYLQNLEKKDIILS